MFNLYFSVLGLSSSTTIGPISIINHATEYINGWVHEIGSFTTGDIDYQSATSSLCVEWQFPTECSISISEWHLFSISTQILIMPPTIVTASESKFSICNHSLEMYVGSSYRVLVTGTDESGIQYSLLSDGITITDSSPSPG